MTIPTIEANVIEVMDISGNQPCGECSHCKHEGLEAAIDWDKLDPAIVAVAVKASEGLNYEDPCFRFHCAGVRRAARALIAYHYLRIRHTTPQDAAAQAAQFVALLAREKIEYAAVDVETKFNEHATPEDAHEAVHDFLASFATYGAALLVYTSPGEWEGWNLHVTLPQASAFQLWLADYEAHAHVPPPWKSFLLWQYDGKGKIDGVRGDVDRSRSYCTLISLLEALTPTG